MFLHIYKNNPTAGGTDGTQVSETISSTLSAATTVGATTITVATADAPNFNISGLAIKIGTESTAVTSVSGNVITVPALTSIHASGETVINTAAGSNPITFGPLDATAGAESTAQTLAIRADTGYVTGAVTTLTPSGTNAADVALSADGTTWLAYGTVLTLATGIGATNVLFYAKAKAIAGESPQNDTMIKIAFDCATVQAA
jgi:hypothetical protein